MIRATTPTQRFYLHTSDVKELLITYKQGEDIILQKTLEDVTFVEGVASFVMSQEETNTFSKGLINVDVRILTEDNVSVASQIFTISARDVLDSQILGDGTKPSVDDCACTFDCHFDGCECYNAQYEELIKGDKGDTGNGIKSTTLNDDFTLTIRFTDGTSYTTPSIRGMRGERGEQGEKGETGERGADGYTPQKNIDYFDGKDGLNGKDGRDGLNGVGIASTRLNADYTLTITLTDGSSYTTPSIRGERGERGLKGDKGDTYELTQTDRTDIANIVTTDIIDDSSVANNKVWSAQKINDLRERIEDFENSKMPNVIIHGEPTINGSQMSGFSPNAYAMFPFLVSLTNPFEIRFAFTTGTDVVNQQNILDSDFGLAFAIRNSHFVIALSTNGTSWDLGEGVGSLVVQPMTSYLVKITWDGATYRVSYSRDMGATYTVDITKTSSLPLAPKQMYIGVGESGATVLNSFGGVIDFRYAQLTVNNIITWLGFADIGVLSRLATDLENIDPSGEQKIKDIVNTYTKDEIDASQTEQNNILTELLYRSIDKERSLEYLWKKSKGILFDEETVNSLENTVSVPSGAMEYASLDMLGGSSIKFNQLANFTETVTSKGVAFTVSSDNNLVIDGTASGQIYQLINSSYNTAIGHKYYVSQGFADPTGNLYVYNDGGGITLINVEKAIKEATASKKFYVRIISGYTVSNVNAKIRIVDLTEMFGSGNEPTSLEDARIKQLERTLEVASTYNEGSIIDAKVDEIRWLGNKRELLNAYQLEWLMNNQNVWLTNNVVVYYNTSLKNVYLVKHDNGIYYRAYVSASAFGNFVSTTDAQYINAYNNVSVPSIFVYLYANNGILYVDSSSSIGIPQKGSYPKPIPSQVQALDGYGIGINDTLYNSLEFTGDKVLFNKRVGSVDLGEQSWSYSTYAGISYFRTTISDCIVNVPTTSNKKPLCSKYDSITPKYIAYFTSDKSVMYKVDGQGIYVRDDSYTDATSFKNAMNGVMLYYELAEPQVIDVTEYFTEDFNFLQTEANGSIEFHYPSKDDGYELNTHSTVTYMVDVNEVA